MIEERGFAIANGVLTKAEVKTLIAVPGTAGHVRGPVERRKGGRRNLLELPEIRRMADRPRFAYWSNR